MRLVKVDIENYPLFNAMVYFRINGVHMNDFDSYKVPKEIQDELANENLFVFAAETDGKFVGWISMIYMPKVGKYNGAGHIYVDELWVQADYRKSGVAKSLLEKADEIKELTNAIGVRLYVSCDNYKASKLYEKAGFQDKGKCIFMEK